MWISIHIEKVMHSKISYQKYFKERLQRLFITLTSILLCCRPVFSSDAFAIADTATTSLTDKLTILAVKLFPLSLIIIVVLMFCTQDQRKLSMEWKALIGVIAVFILLLLVKNDVIIPTIEDIIGLSH